MRDRERDRAHRDPLELVRGVTLGRVGGRTHDVQVGTDVVDLAWSDGGDTLAVGGASGALVWVDAASGAVERAPGDEVDFWSLRSAGETFLWYDPGADTTWLRADGRSEPLISGSCAAPREVAMTDRFVGVARTACPGGRIEDEVWAWSATGGLAGPWHGAGAALLDGGLAFGDGHAVRWTDGVSEPVTLDEPTAGFATDGERLVTLHALDDGSVELAGDAPPLPVLGPYAQVAVAGGYVLAADAAQVVVAPLR